jgi:hypothetical protein
LTVISARDVALRLVDVEREDVTGLRVSRQTTIVVDGTHRMTVDDLEQHVAALDLASKAGLIGVDARK